MVESVPAMASAEELLTALRRTPATGGGGGRSAMIDRVQEWKCMGESIFKSLADCFFDIESREENLRLVSESLEVRLRDLEEKEWELKLLQEGESEALKLREEELKSGEVELNLREEKLDEQLKSIGDQIERLECEKLKEIEKKERELNTFRGLMEKRLGEFEKREKEFSVYYDGKLRELTLKEEILGKEKREFAEEVRLTNEKVKEKQKMGCELIERLELALNKLGGMKVIMDERFKEIESRETMAHESLTARLNEADLIQESLEKRFKELEDFEKELNFSQEDKTRRWKEKEWEFKLLQEEESEALKLREEELKSGEVKLKLREEKLDEQLKSVGDHIERLECEKLKEIEKKERELNTFRGLMEKQLGEFEKREKEFSVYYDGKLRELTLKEEVLGKEKREFAEEVRLTNEKVKEKQKMGCELIERLELALNMLGGMKVIMDERFKEIELRETMTHESLTARLNEADLIQESLEKRFKELEDFEKELNFSQEDKTRKLESKEQQLGTARTDKVKLRGEKSSEQQKLGLQMLEKKPEEKKQEHDCREKNLSFVRESAQIKENLALASKLDQPQKQSEGTDADRGQQVCGPREVDLMGKLRGLKQPVPTATTNACSTIKREKSVDSRHALQEDRKKLQMLINGPEKDLELMGDEIYKILSTSSESAKLVLEAIQGFYALRTGILDTECKERRDTILMLHQLTNLSPEIQPCVTEAAIKLALEWKSSISYAAENPVGALAFLHLVAAYNLSSHFDKNDLFEFLKLAARHKHRPDLCHILGLAEKIPGYIRKLINDKRYLLASTYIYEYQLHDMFPQAAILNYYVSYSKLSANAKCRSELNSSEAQEKAIASEIAALRVAIEHIIKYDLESAFSPNVLTARIKQLEADQAGLRRGISAPSADKKVEGKGNKLSKRARRRLVQEARKSGASLVLNPPQMVPYRGPNSWSSPAGGPQHLPCVTETRHACLPNSWFPMPRHPVGPCKRRRTNKWMNGGGLHLGQFY